MSPAFRVQESTAVGVSPVLGDVEAFVRRYVSFPDLDSCTATILWIAHAHLLEAFETTPRIAFLSTEPGSGKSRALEVVSALVPRPMMASDASVAVLYHMTSKGRDRPTICYDEVDTVFGQRVSPEAEDLRRLLNSGHRRGASVYRMDGVGANMMPREFPVFAAVALAGLGNVPDTITTRSVVVRMRRRAPNEHVQPWRERDARPEADLLRASLEEWTETIFRLVDGARPDLPPIVTDRPADVWEPLIAVADAAGGEWPERARTAAVNLLESTESRVSVGIQLLRDVRTILGEQERMSSVQLVTELLDLQDAPWSDLAGKEFTVNDLSRWLRKYEIRPRSIRFGAQQQGVQRGYYRADFADAFARYLPPEAAEVATETAPPPEVPPVELF
ncbi:DUF3631 domain-containing protein [Plantibacter sp. VKM Ac-2880]|uniref:DUF3631 domain-containing protein n=1 Tax=Plantibacter sp. VKM Ac-2880 TaxID=2783827 RepID=UPI00351C01E6